MGSELVGSLPTNPKEQSFTNLFWEALPAYLSMGMSSSEYWDGDAELCVAYRRAHKEQMRLQDLMEWRQGLYFYHALNCSAPAFNSLKPHKPHDYIKPFGFEPKAETEDARQDAGLAYVKAWADKVNNMRKNNGNTTIR